eukprot:2275837-Prymnesium_polylepis.1
MSDQGFEAVRSAPRGYRPCHLRTGRSKVRRGAGVLAIRVGRRSPGAWVRQERRALRTRPGAPGGAITICVLRA